MPRPPDERPDEKPIVSENSPMAYPISVLLAELQRVKHKITELETEQSKPVKIEGSNGCMVLVNGPAVLKAFRERQSCIGALKAKVARLSEAIHMLGGGCGCMSRREGDQYPNLLHMGVLLKHFPSLAKGATDIRVIRDLELQAFELEE